MKIDDIPELTNRELLNLIFSNPFVTEKAKDAAVNEYRKRMGKEVEKETKI